MKNVRISISTETVTVLEETLGQAYRAGDAA